MDSSLIEVTIPTFVNIHLFWVIPVKDLILRSAMAKIMKSQRPKRIEDRNDIHINKMVAINKGNLWARAVIQHIMQLFNETEYICWLPDFGVFQIATYVFHLPEELIKCPELAKQASLHNVVNLTQDLILGNNGYEIQLKKTTEDIPGVRRVALNSLEEAQKTLFSVISKDQYNLYGDIILLYEGTTRQSLTKHLMNKNVVQRDEHIFNSIDTSRRRFKEKYVNHSPNWQQPLDLPEKNKLPGIIFNKDENISMGFFKRLCANGL